MKREIFAILSASSLMLSFVGCSGDTAGGSYPGQALEGSGFSPDESNSGSISLELNEDEIGVAEISGFHARATNSQGSGVTNAAIVCDTERGLALIEPSSGREITDESGSISGKVGCEAPGSFRVGCRLASATRRAYQTIRCSGSIPNGFGGFPHAGGRGLGGAGGVGDDGTPGGNTSDSVRILNISFEDGLETGVANIDIARKVDCDGVATTNDPEPFSDTFVRVTIANDSASTLTFRTLRITVPGGLGADGEYRSSDIALTGDAFDVLPNGQQNTFITRVLYQKSKPTTLGNEYGNGKAFVGSKLDIYDQVGGRLVTDVTITVVGTDSEGNSVSVRGSVNLYFHNVDRCGT